MLGRFSRRVAALAVVAVAAPAVCAVAVPATAQAAAVFTQGVRFNQYSSWRVVMGDHTGCAYQVMMGNFGGRAYLQLHLNSRYACAATADTWAHVYFYPANPSYFPRDAATDATQTSSNVIQATSPVTAWTSDGWVEVCDRGVFQPCDEVHIVMYP